MVSCLITFLLFNILAAVAAPLELAPRQFPPSSPHGRPGTLIEPVEGQVYTSPGPLRILYKRSVSGGYSTQSIQTDVENIGGGPEALLINALESLNAGTDEYIDAVVAAPEGFCGQQQFLVFETQRAPDGSIVQFQSATPNITFHCNGGEYPPSPTTYSGPHGTLLSPAPNTHYYNDAGAGVNIHLKYQPLIENHIDTLTLQLALVQNYLSYQLSFALAATSGQYNGVIEQYFAAPSECLCGTFNLTVYETQDLYGSDITFLTYTVPLEFTCPASILSLCSG